MKGFPELKVPKTKRKSAVLPYYDDLADPTFRAVMLAKKTKRPVTKVLRWLLEVGLEMAESEGLVPKDGS